MKVIDRAVHNSPPPLDDVGGCEATDFDENDPTRKWTEALKRWQQWPKAHAEYLRRLPKPAFSPMTEAEFATSLAHAEAYFREAAIDEAVRRVSDALAVNPDKLLTLFPPQIIKRQVELNFRMILDQVKGDMP